MTGLKNGSEPTGPAQPPLESGKEPSATENGKRSPDKELKEDLNEITTQGEKSSAEKIRSALRLGAEHLGAKRGHLARIDLATATREVVETSGGDSVLTGAEQRPLSGTYCRETLVCAEPHVIEGGAEEEGPSDSAGRSSERSRYLGAKVFLGERLFGTVFFTGAEAEKSLPDAPRADLELIARHVGRQLQADRRQVDSGKRGNLEEPRSLLRRIQTVAGVGGWEYDPDADAVRGTEELYRLLGLPEEAEFDLERGLSFSQAEARETVESAVQACIEEGTPFDLEVPIVTAQGDRRWARVRGERQRRASGSILLIGTLQDITEQKEIEQTLREEQETLRRMYRITAGRQQSFEEKMDRLLDLGREHLQLPYGHVTRISEGTQEIAYASGGHPLIEPGNTCPLSKAYCRKTIEQEGPLAVQNAPKEGWEGDPAYEAFGLDAYIGSKIRVGGDLYGTFCFAAESAREKPFAERERTFVELLTLWTGYEIAQRRAKRRLKAQNERLDRFASVVSHDLRNPLNVAQGRFHLAREKVQSEGKSGNPLAEALLTDGHLASAGRALDRMNEIIEDMLVLTWGRREVGSGDTQPIDLAGAARRCWSHVAAEEGSSLSVESAPPITAHEGRLQQLLENLFRNAIEHGGKEVSVRIGALPEGFYVEDDGPGIPEDKREKVLETGYSTNEEGTGLGLSIAGAVADAHGWDVAVTEGTEGGARFEIREVEKVKPGGV